MSTTPPEVPDMDNTLLGMAVRSVARRHNHDQDARGFNRALDAIQDQYKRLKAEYDEIAATGTKDDFLNWLQENWHGRPQPTHRHGVTPPSLISKE